MLPLRKSIEDGARKDEKAEQEHEKVGLDHDDKDTLSGETIPGEGENRSNITGLRIFPRWMPY